jgi:hypothetical protein
MKVYDTHGNLLISSGGGGEGGGSKIIDADGDTWVDVEKNADEDKIRMGVKGVETFLLHDDGILDLVKQSSARAYRHAAQSINPNGWRKLDYDVENYDIQDEFDITTNHRFVTKNIGTYLIIAQAYLLSLSAGDFLTSGIFVNGGVRAHSKIWMHLGGTGYVTAIDLARLTTSDYVEGYIYHTHSAALSTSSPFCFIAIHKLA